MLLDQDAALRGAELLDDTMFYREGHRRLFRAILALTERRVVIDHVTLRDELLRRGELDVAGGVAYLADLVDAVPTAANIEFHARIVKDKAILRRLIETGVRDGVFVVESPRLAAYAILDMGAGVAGWFRPGDAVRQDELAIRYADFALRLVGARRAGRRSG